MEFDAGIRMQELLAWWLWAIKRTRTFTINDIPISLSRGFVADGEDAIGALREQLVGSIVEERSLGSLLNEKNAGTFYFPHLSFTEFLVSDYLLHRELTESDYNALSQSFEGEIQSFLLSYPKGDACFNLYSGLRGYRGTLPINLILFLASSSTLRQKGKTVLKAEVFSPWQFAIEFFALIETEHRPGIMSKCADVDSF